MLKRIVNVMSILLACAILVPLLRDSGAPPQVPENDASGDTGRGRRWEFEFMRLRDPVTDQIPADIHRREREFASQLPSRRGSALQERIQSEDPAKADKMIGWVPRGPKNIGGRTRALAFDVSDPTWQTLLAGGVSGGMWRSTDDGASWTLTTGSTQLHSVVSVAQDTRPGHENVWYYGTGEFRGQSAGVYAATYRGDGVFKSTDGGQSWTQLPVTAGGRPSTFNSFWQYVHRLRVDPSNPTEDEVYAAIFGYILRSVNGGNSWSVTLGAGANPADWSMFTELVVTSTGVVYASLSTGGHESGFYRSTDGVNWTDITPPTLTSFERVVLVLAPSDENILYALVENTNGSGLVGLYKYTHSEPPGSGTWEDRSAQIALLPGLSGAVDWVPDTQGNYNMSLAVNPVSPDVVYMGCRLLWRSLDGFATDGFTDLIGGRISVGHHEDQHDLIFQPGSSAMAYSATDGGVHKILNINSATAVEEWLSLNNGYDTSQFYRIAIDEDLPGNQVIVGGTQDNGSWFTMWEDGETDWVNHVGGDGGHSAVVDADSPSGNYLYSYQEGRIYRRTVDNTTGQWFAWSRLDPAGVTDYLFINPFLMDPVDNHVVYQASGGGLWRNNDFTGIPDNNGSPTAINWDQVTTQPSGENISALGMSRTGNRVLYFGTAVGSVFRLDQAHTAPVGSAPQTLNMGPDFVSGAFVTSISVHPGDDQKVMLAVSNYNVDSIFYTEDGGATWTSQEGNLVGLYGPSVRDVAILDFQGKEIYFAATSTGLYSTFYMAGANTYWQLEAPGLIGNVVVDDVAVRHADGFVAVGTHGRGTYSIFVPVGTPVTEDSPAAVGFLAQNKPNPFNPRTTIAFELPTAGRTRLAVYDVSGRLVRTLVDEDLGEGPHEVVWSGRDDDGKQVASGVFFYRLEAGEYSENRRMTLVK
ncbi:MAG: FlgD immunoglobulin-like domain containing protein [Candidatus Krumholzibacteriota bacterium]